MTHRWVFLRTVSLLPNTDSIELLRFNLFWAALAAAEETLQGGIWVREWLNLFSASLSKQAPSWLQWAGDMGESAEIRRAYSALYGRFFSRGIMQGRFGYRGFVPLRRNKTSIRGGIEVQRILPGDIPDWFALGPNVGSYALIEAKGSLTGSSADFLKFGNQPNCIGQGLQQFTRVSVAKKNAPLSYKKWVIGNLWSTDVRARAPVILAWDPPVDGGQLGPDEEEQHERAFIDRWVSSIALGFGRPDLYFRSIRGERKKVTGAVNVRVSPSDDSSDVPDDIYLGVGVETPAIFARRQRMHIEIQRGFESVHEGRYIFAVINSFGVVPVTGESAYDQLVALQQIARQTKRPTMVVGLSTAVLEKEKIEPIEVWYSPTGVVGRSGLAIFNIANVEFSQ